LSSTKRELLDIKRPSKPLVLNPSQLSVVSPSLLRMPLTRRQIFLVKSLVSEVKWLLPLPQAKRLSRESESR
jgi:hypothetical protein